jgi:hypothetical protein
LAVSILSTRRKEETMDDVLLLSRNQFSLTIMSHNLVPPLSIGLGAFMDVSVLNGGRTSRPATRRWMRLLSRDGGATGRGSWRLKIGILSHLRQSRRVTANDWPRFIPTFVRRRATTMWESLQQQEIANRVAPPPSYGECKRNLPDMQGRARVPGAPA